MWSRVFNPHSEVLLIISMTSSTCGVHRVVSAEIVQHRVVNGDEARGRSIVHRYVEVGMSMWGNKVKQLIAT